MNVVTSSFTPVDDLQTTERKFGSMVFYRSHYVDSLECVDVVA